MNITAAPTSTTDDQIVLTSSAMHVASGLRMVAKNLIANISDGMCHERFVQIEEEVQALMLDAHRLVGTDQHDRAEIWVPLNDASYRVSAVRYNAHEQYRSESYGS